MPDLVSGYKAAEGENVEIMVWGSTETASARPDAKLILPPVGTLIEWDHPDRGSVRSEIANYWGAMPLVIHDGIPWVVVSYKRLWIGQPNGRP